MKLKDIISAGLLPRFAKDSTWMQEALDSWIRPAVGCFAALGAPFTLEAVQALTDAELQELYAQYNIVDYYPDLSRETRELMIYNISKLRRRLGTKAAVVALVQYVFDGLDLTVDIYDNLAFNDAGELIDESLIDVYDVEITLSDAVLTDEIRKRLLNNIFRLVPDRLGLGNIIYIYPANYIQNRQIIVADIETVIENDAVCEPITPPVQALTGWAAAGEGTTIRSVDTSGIDLYFAGAKISYDATREYTLVSIWGYYSPRFPDIANLDRNLSHYTLFNNSGYLAIKSDGYTEYGYPLSLNRIEYTAEPKPYIDVILGLCKRNIGSPWLQVNMYNGWWYTLLTTDDDVTRLEEVGVPLIQNPTSNVFSGAYCLRTVGSSDFDYKIIEVYTDLGITTITDYPISELSFGTSRSYITIDGSGYEGINRSDVMSVKCRLTKL